MKQFLESMGLEPLLSEHPAFPVNPHIGTTENCVSVVKERADIFVLIIGARYGSQTESGKSITNLEYLEAKAKGIPVFVFVLKQVLHLLPVWRQNPDGNYQGVVDTPKLLQFVESIRSSKDHWVYDFENVGHVVEVLKNQLALMFMEGLTLRYRFNSRNLSPVVAQLTGRALKLAVERPEAWEYFLFSSVLAEELSKNQELKWDLKHGLKIGPVRPLGDAGEVVNWVKLKLSEITSMVHSLERLMNQGFQEALGAPGISGDADHIVYIARRIAALHASLLKWTIEFNCVEVDDTWKRLFGLIAHFSSDAILKHESIPGLLESEIGKAIAARAKGEKYVANVQLTITTEGGDEIVAEFTRIRESYGLADN